MVSDSFRKNILVIISLIINDSDLHSFCVFKSVAWTRLLKRKLSVYECWFRIWEGSWLNLRGFQLCPPELSTAPHIAVTGKIQTEDKAGFFCDGESCKQLFWASDCLLKLLFYHFELSLTRSMSQSSVLN